MGSLGNDADDTEPISKNAKVDLADTQVLESQLSPPLPSGEGDRDANELCYFEDTEPFGHTIPNDDPFETQLVDLCGETQLVNLSSETQATNLDGETQIFEHLDCIGNMDTQLLDEFENEVALDSDDEGTAETEVLCYNDELSDDDTTRWNNGQSDYREKMQSSCLDEHKEEGAMEQDDVLTDKQHNSGSLAMVFTSLRIASLRASGLAAQNMALKLTNKELHSEKHANETNGLPCIRGSPEIAIEVIQEHDWGNCNENGKELGSEGKSGIARKLFIDEEDTEFPHNGNIANKGEEFIHLPVCNGDVAGLSYVDSQEPGDLSQINALDFVDKFLKTNTLEFDLDTDIGNSKRGKLNSLSSAKGPQSLAKLAKDKFTVRERGVFDWDDNREDEGGGDIFCRKKEYFVDNRRLLFRTQKPKKNIVNKLKDRLINSDSRLMMLGANGAKKGAQMTELSFKRNLVNEFDECHGTTVVTDTNVPGIPDTGFDTQMAAEAMEALWHGEDLANGACVGTKKNLKVSPDGDCGGNNEFSVCLKQRTRGCPSNTGVITRQSKKRIGADFCEEALISLEKSSKIVGKQVDILRGTKRLEQAQSNRSGNLKKVQAKDSEQRNARVSKRSCSGNGVVDGTGLQSVAALTKKRGLEGKGITMPVAKRTRHSLVRAQSTPSGCEEEEDLSKIEVHKEKRKNNTSSKGSSLSKAKQKKSLSGESKNDASKPSARQRDTGQAISGLKKSDCNRRLPIDLGTKRRTRSFSNQEVFLHQNLVEIMAVKHSEKKVDADPLSPQDHAEATTSTRLNNSPGMKSSPPDSPSVTPTSCTTPVHDTSPVCMGDEYYRQVCKRSQSRSCLTTRKITSLSSPVSERTLVSKDLRKRRAMADVGVLYSRHLDDDIVKQQKKILARFGVSIASSVSDATHFIADKFVRTRNMLEAIASGKPVVTHLWIESCGQANRFIDEKSYILRDVKKEREFGFCMPVSLARANQCPLLQGRRVFITPNTKPGKEIISNLVRAVHGQALERIGRSALKDDKVPDDLLVLSCEEDEALCVPFLEKGASVYSSELLLNGIVTQTLDYERHSLFADHVKRTRSTIWMRKDGYVFQPVAKQKRR